MARTTSWREILVRLLQSTEISQKKLDNTVARVAVVSTRQRPKETAWLPGRTAGGVPEPTEFLLQSRRLQETGDAPLSPISGRKVY